MMGTARMPFDLDRFPQIWLDDWNSHDIERILAHYDEAVRFLSPFARVLTGSGVIEGKAALRAYWGPALANRPELRFRIEAAYFGHQSLSLHYRDERDRSVMETLVFNDAGQVVFGTGCYATPPMEAA